VNVPAGTKIRLEFANINNPLSPSANYKVTVTTRNAANTPIDGPTPSTAYTMKQIGANAIATTFAYQRNLLDGESGWDPDGAATVFTITDPLVTSSSLQKALLNLSSPSISGPVCGVTFIGSSLIQVTCTSPPVDGTELQYAVFSPAPA
jgi:hypothetical protein